MSEIEQGKIHDAAMVAHEANRAYCLTVGDSSQSDWKSAPGWQRDSAIAGAAAIAANPATTPEQSHEGWTAQKVADGWVYGPVKDAEKKTHPCLVPYDELPAFQRVKDALFGAAVRAVLGFHQPADLATDYALAIDDHNVIVETLEAENERLRHHIADLRAELASWVSDPVADRPVSATEPTEAEGAES